jgi:ABC-type transport system involved in cytochrome c biogenesis permease component
MSDPSTSATIDTLDFSDRLQPVLVKELRQSLRGPWFRRSYLFLLFAGGGIAISTLMYAAVNEISHPVGRQLFIILYGALTFGLCALLPLQTYLSVGSEFEDGTLELLLLSDVGSQRVVHGKLFAVGIQGLLLLSAFLPLMALAYLAQGVDLIAMALVLALSLCACLMACAAAAWISAHLRQRLVRMLGLALVAFGGIGMAMILSMPLGISILSGELELLSLDNLMAWGAGMLGLLAGAAWFVAGARAAFEPAGGDTLAPLRQVVWITLLVFVALMIVMALIPGLDPSLPVGFLATAAAILPLPYWFLVTDGEQSGRREQTLRASRRTLRWAGRPGGAWGYVQLLASYALLTTCAVTIGGINAAGTIDDNLFWALAVFMTYGAFYLGVPSALTAMRTQTPRGRSIARLWVLGFTIACMFLPMLIGGMIGDYELSTGEHWLNMGYALSREDDSVFALLGLGLLSLCFNLPRLLLLLVADNPGPQEQTPSNANPT